MTSAAHEFDRVIPLEGGHNFRDIGGYRTQDGRTVAKGLVYRSGTMSELSDCDHAALDALGLQVICDFRSTRERNRRPSRLPDAATYEIWSRDHQMSAGDLTEAMQHADATPEKSRQLMIEAYHDLAYEQAPSYRELFQRLAYGTLPLVFHCAAGKDRTGVAAALLLDLLGVSRDQVIEDYKLTDQFFSRGCELVTKDPIGNKLANVAREIWEPMMRADPGYLTAMFDTIEARHGSAEGFIREELALDDAGIAAIRTRLLV
ncbi:MULTISPECIES: tyrosine-protein phosphatase [Sphingobium]|uniref:tyrosine-protein phosphatase n=1 Tax=Sphingobium sp. MI1205 TaxID=407020 RepID=UPI0007701752|nr:tyrosine-protein phosphatase [Sphingobium sp. MI1205]AMK19873.1 protein tyrosine/serine phosphatase [Sphingobium sp. MI1205]